MNRIKRNTPSDRTRVPVRIGAAVGGLILAQAAFAAAVSKPTPKVDYGRDIRPILSANCFACHGQDDKARQAGLRLDLRDAAVAKAIVPGKPERSPLVARVNATDGTVMPPAASGHTLKPEQKALLTEWVRQGAVYSQHWAFTPIKLPTPPAVKNTKWARSPMDRFVLARLEAAGLAPSPEADRATLIRRVSLDLTGLPPTPEDVDAFLKDRSPNAYEKVVDRLLASPRYGEHWARMWLDLARYADTQGYEKDLPRTIWRYRDWVIDAYNRDMPYDRFTIEQLAGDLLPNATPSQILATAFHRNTMTNTEGGTDPEEFRTAAVKDRVDTTVQVWMGLTMGCAKCHSHKYDPITQADYYKFFALFNQTEDANRFDEFPTAQMPTAEQETRLNDTDERLKMLRFTFWKPMPELDGEQRTWEGEQAANSFWKVPHAGAVAESGAALQARADGSVLASGAHNATDLYTVTLDLPDAPVRSLRLEVLKDASLPNGGPGRDGADPNVVVSEIAASWIAKGKTEGTPVPLQNARADFQQNGWPVTSAIDGKPETGWAFSPQVKQPHVALFDLGAPAVGGKLVVTLRQNYPNLQLGCFRLSVSSAEPQLLKPELTPLSEIAGLPRERRTEAQQKQLDEAFRRTHAPTANVYAELKMREKEREDLEKEIPRIPILHDLAGNRQRVTHIHQRGNFLDPGETVTGAVPASFGTIPTGAPANRLGAAEWLVAKENPLTARVEANRIWARLFGTGIVESEEDFGLQGIPPSNQELLDYLAATFRDELKWSQKALLKQIVLSATYRQSGATTPDRLAKDPNNLLFSRGPRFRLGAEVLRDQALAVSGLLSAKMNGPSVMPPQPDGIWKTVYSGVKWETSQGEDRYRRALYTFWRRTSPYPSLTTFDAGSGEFCVIRRVRTNTPLQALVLLNDPAFVEAAGALGKQMVQQKSPAPKDRIAYGFRRVLSRAPAEAELTRLVHLYETTLAELKAKPDGAAALLKSANSAAEGSTGSEQAAYTVIANVLLNLDEALTKP